MKKVAILQSNYIPWKGYFDIINLVDEFILYDDMQYTRRDWRNRNQIKTVDGVKWLTIPVDTKGKFFQKINETKVSDHKWAEAHWKAICLNYAKAPYFKTYEPLFEELYRKAGEMEEKAYALIPTGMGKQLSACPMQLEDYQHLAQELDSIISSLK